MDLKEILKKIKILEFSQMILLIFFKKKKEIEFFEKRIKNENDIYNFESINSFDILHNSFSFFRFILNFLIGFSKIILNQNINFKNNFKLFLEKLNKILSKKKKESSKENDEEEKLKKNNIIKKNTNFINFKKILTEDFSKDIIEYILDLNKLPNDEFQNLIEEILENYKKFIQHIKKIYEIMEKKNEVNEKTQIEFCKTYEKIFNFIYIFNNFGNYYPDYIFFYTNFIFILFIFKNFKYSNLNVFELNNKIIKNTFNSHTMKFNENIKIPDISIKKLNKSGDFKITNDINSIMNCFVFIFKNKISDFSFEKMDNVKIIPNKDLKINHELFEYPRFDCVKKNDIDLNNLNENKKILEHLKNLENLSDEIEKYKYNNQNRKNLKQKDENLELPDNILNFLTDYQKLILFNVWKLIFRDQKKISLIFNLFMGSGKSIIAVVLIIVCFSTFKYNIIFVTLKSLTLCFEKELKKFIEKFEIQYLKIKTILSNFSKKKISKTLDLFTEKKIKILIISKNIFKKNFLKLNSNFDMILLDELQQQHKNVDLIKNLNVLKIGMTGFIFNNKLKNLLDLLKLINFSSNENETIKNVDKNFLSTIDKKFEITEIKVFLKKIIELSNIITLNQNYFFKFLSNTITIKSYEINIEFNEKQKIIFNKIFENKNINKNQTGLDYLEISVELLDLKDDYVFNFEEMPKTLIFIDLINYCKNNNKSVVVFHSLLEVLKYLKLLLLYKKLVSEEQIYFFNGVDFKNEDERFLFFHKINENNNFKIILFSSDLGVGINITNIDVVIEMGNIFNLN
jgi:hypothetical protein